MRSVEDPDIGVDTLESSRTLTEYLPTSVVTRQKLATPLVKSQRRQVVGAGGQAGRRDGEQARRTTPVAGRQVPPPFGAQTCGASAPVGWSEPTSIYPPSRFFAPVKATSVPQAESRVTCIRWLRPATTPPPDGGQRVDVFDAERGTTELDRGTQRCRNHARLGDGDIDVLLRAVGQVELGYTHVASDEGVVGGTRRGWSQCPVRLAGDDGPSRCRPATHSPRPALPPGSRSGYSWWRHCRCCPTHT